MNFFASLRLSRHVYYTAVYCAGYFLSANICGTAFEIYPFINGVVLINILFATSLMLNNYYDISIDAANNKCNPLNTGVARKPEYLKAFFFLFASSLAISLSLSPAVFLAALAVHAVAWIYSCPPLRIKRFFPFNTLLIAFSTVLALVLGFFTPGGVFSKLPFTAIAVFTGLLFLSFNTKDVNDCDGDKKYSIQTIMTILGPENGRLVIAALAYAAYLLAALAAKSRMLLVYSILLGGATFYLIMRRGKINEPLIFALMFIFAAVFIFLNPLKF
jgi:4-hydroxybenzoate polyprenyltransferase